MTTVAFPVLARTAGARRDVRPAPPDGPDARDDRLPAPPGSGACWRPSSSPGSSAPPGSRPSLPTQLLAGAGAATVVIDAVGTVFMATGRSRALLGFGVAHFVVYIAVVLFASNWGVTGVAIAASGVHLAFVVVAYQMLLHGRTEKTLRLPLAGRVGGRRLVRGDGRGGLCRSSWRSSSAGAPAVVHVVVVGAVGGIVYLAALRLWFADAWSDLSALLRPVRRAQAVIRRVPCARKLPISFEACPALTLDDAQRQRRHPLLQVRPLPAGLRAQRARPGGRRRPRPDHRRRFARRQRPGGARPGGRRRARRGPRPRGQPGPHRDLQRGAARVGRRATTRS